MTLSKATEPATALPRAEREQLVRRKKKARMISQTAGALGLSALALRVPQGTKVATLHTPSLRVKPGVRRMLELEPKATSLSNALTTVGAGVGATGSFNFAGIQRQEAKAEEKSLRKSYETSTRRRQSGETLAFGAGAVGLGAAGAGVTAAKWTPSDKVAGIKDAIDRSVSAVRSNAEGMGRGRPTLTARALSSPTGRNLGSQYVKLSQLARKYPGASAAAAVGLKGAAVASGVKAWHARSESSGASYEIADRRIRQRRRKVAKADDRFLRQYRERISPDAERGYEYLRAGRNNARAQTLGWGALTAGSVAGVPGLMRKHPVLAGASAASAGASSYLTAQQGGKARRWERRMSKIRARAYQRERDGQFGRGRVGKSMPMPRSTPVKPGFATRSGGIVRSGSKTFTRRGAIAGTGKMRPTGRKL